jgi:uridine kinase
MEITDNTDEVIQKIQKECPRIIGIDGVDGAGKTTIAKRIGKYSYHRISLDNYLRKKKDGYFKFLNIENLKKDINNLKNEPVIIEGVLLLKVLEAANINLNYFIYVDDNAWLVGWLEDYGGEYCGKRLDEIIAEEEKMVNRVVQATDPGSKEYKMEGFRKEIFEYSFEYKPWDKADIILRTQ